MYFFLAKNAVSEMDIQKYNSNLTIFSIRAAYILVYEELLFFATYAARCFPAYSSASDS